MKTTNLIFILILSFTNSTNISATYKGLFKQSIIGYDCSNLINSTSYKINDIENCEENLIRKPNRNIDVQILQKSNKFTNTALTCSLRRTKQYHIAVNIIMDFPCMKVNQHIQNCQSLIKIIKICIEHIDM